MIKRKGAVFGSSKTDFTVLLLPVLAAIALSQVFSLLAPQQLSYWYFPILITLLDTPHIVCGYWVMFRQKDQHNHLRLKLLAWLVAFFLLYLYLLNYDQVEFALTFLALSSVWHFIRQHQAWFYLAMRGTPSEGRQTLWINKLGIGAVTWGFFLIGQCREERDGWFAMNDLFLLPEALKWPLTLVVSVLILSYIFYHVRLTLRHREVALSAHMVWVSAILVWGGARLVDVNYLSSALIVIPHAVSYVFLLQRYERKDTVQRARFTPLMGLVVAYVIGMTFQGYRYLPLLSEAAMDEFSWVAALIMAASVAHYVHDKLFWNARTNPGWQKRM